MQGTQHIQIMDREAGQTRMVGHMRENEARGRRNGALPVTTLALHIFGVLLLKEGHLAEQARSLELGVQCRIGEAKSIEFAVMQEVEALCQDPLLADYEASWQLHSQNEFS